MAMADEAAGPRSLWTWLFNPFHYVAGFQALAAGLLAIVATAILGWAGRLHTDGVLDLHFGPAVPLGIFVAEGLIAWLSLALVLLPVGLAMSRRFRAIDVFGTTALARWPILLCVGPALLPGVRRCGVFLTAKVTGGKSDVVCGAFDLSAFVAFTLLGLVAVVWLTVLSYRAFAVSCNLHGARAVVAFVVAMIVAEVISKVVIVALVSRFSGPV